MKTATITSATSTGPLGTPADINATPTASPSLVYLNDAMGKVTPYVAVGTTDGRVLTFNTLTLAAGPTIMGLGGAVSTPSVPVTAAGMTPGATGADAPKAPFIYATATTATDTLVHRLTQDANAMTLTEVTSPTLPGLAGTAVATNQEATATDASEGVVLVTTGKNLFSLSTTDLTVKAKLDGGDAPRAQLDRLSAQRRTRQRQHRLRHPRQRPAPDPRRHHAGPADRGAGGARQRRLDDGIRPALAVPPVPAVRQ